MNDARPFTVAGNQLTLLIEGPERLNALIDLIEGARRSLRMLYYIYADDHAGERVNEALIDAANRGVEVSLIVDGFGSDEAADRRFFDPLEAAGISVCRFVPRLGRRYLLRNHQKLALADAEEAAPRIIVGGFNIEDDYFGTAGDQAWRDLGLLMEGPAAARIAGYFDALNAWVREPKGKLRHLNRALSQWSEQEGEVRWLIGGPTRRLSPWARAVRGDMRRAERIDIIAAYFTPSPTMLRQIDRAGRKGRVVRVVTARKSDNNATIAAARFTYRGLLKRGIRVFEYLPTKLHTKLYAVDRAVHIGSANFDMRSLFINLELMLRIEDVAFADHVRAYIDGEIAQSEEITMDRYLAVTGLWQRVKQFAAYLLVGVADPMVSRTLNFGIDE
ncbi:phosphatidylserine/phosphatidylglycerophosphate/cardiolipin synthase family protein [Sphingomonas sp. IC-11]|uniref:phospholipase D-like domain-containing protein n=1 Tax=Sphingomonas sp. IC-11 TaxID=2898528 RepID=UPI001E2C9DCF|nr:phosphatidylserine/phosphatidylglycerophosphate/cardiolipin synthase family protein [Sphingomonas sp. IC-11]MCD2317174.1 phosphatidylserine/phosphatidylglycerophosphate/cardiolipin synthase family protein [Sphingomonas sp. IC-11]